MRKRHIGHRFDFLHLDYSQIRLPLVEPKQWVVIGTEVVLQDWPANRAVEHPAEGHAIHDTAVNAKSNNAPRELVHHDENPMVPQCCRFATKAIDTPQPVLRVAQKGQPRGARRIRIRSMVSREDAPDDIFVDLNSEDQSDLLCDSRTSPGRIALFHLDDRFNQLLSGSLWTRLLS